MTAAHNGYDTTFFNDLSQFSASKAIAQDDASIAAPAAVDGPPRPKRIACVLCRKRKLRCDGLRPSCGTCSRLAHDCAYDEIRRKSGPKRGYVKALEARLGSCYSWSCFSYLPSRTNRLR